jgi:uncharacterized protein
MAEQTGALVYSARPTLSVDGRDNASLADGLLGLVVAEDSSGLARCEAVVGNWGSQGQQGLGFLYFDRRLLDFGKPFSVKLGSDVVFDGLITGLEALFPDGRAPRIAILAEDRFQDLRMTRRTRTFSDVSDADIANQIATDHGLQASVELNGPHHAVVAQVNQSDLAFLRERARAVDAEVWIDGRMLHAAPRTRRNGATVRLTHGEELREFSVLADLSMQCTSVMVTGWDVSTKSGLREEAGPQAVSAELDGGTSGASILSSAFGDRKQSLTHTVPLTGDDARARAEAHFRTTARQFLTGRGRAIGDGRLRVGGSVELAGLGPLFNGKYYLAAVQHLFDGVHGLRTEFRAERAWLGAASGG